LLYWWLGDIRRVLGLILAFRLQYSLDQWTHCSTFTVQAYTASVKAYTDNVQVQTIAEVCTLILLRQFFCFFHQTTGFIDDDRTTADQLRAQVAELSRQLEELNWLHRYLHFTFTSYSKLVGL
jgi:preprotein translocase subunit SecY